MRSSWSQRQVEGAEGLLPLALRPRQCKTWKTKWKITEEALRALQGFDFEATRFRPADPKLNLGGRWNVLSEDSLSSAELSKSLGCGAS